MAERGLITGAKVTELFPVNIMKFKISLQFL